MSCIFCEIIKGAKKGHIVYEDAQTIALLDIFPSAEGHLMVIPKKHGVTVTDFSKEELGEIMFTVSKMAEALEKTFNTKSLSIGINHGEFEGVPHLHIHLIPRFKGDGGGIIQSLVKGRIKVSLEETAEKIKKNIL